MKHTYSLLIAFLFLNVSALADYSTPNTTVRWSLDDLVTNSGGNVTFSSGTYFVNGIITISTTDTISITTDAVVKFAVSTHFLVNGSLKIHPPNSVVFTPQVQASGFNGIKFSFSSESIIRKLTLEYAISCNITDCSPVIDSCIFQYNNNNASTSFGNGSIALFRSKALIKNCQFLNNQRAAIQGGANIANAPTIINCLFMGNNTTNQNVPQINLGGSGTDTTKIFNNQILAASTNSGGIGFLPTINLNVLITGNTIQNNRYGINMQGGSLINSVVSYNLIDGNNTQNNPNLGGSGIAFAGGSSTSHQNSIVTGNLIRNNLWGITIQNGAKPNLGNLSNSDTTDDGKNWFYGNSNTNSTTPGIHLYNNTPDPITAQGNYWGSNDPLAIEASIFHQPDLNTLGLVDYSANILPVTLLSFTASTENNAVHLQWKTANEKKTDHFDIERSADAISFKRIGAVTAAGNTVSVSNYSFIDKEAAGTPVYYRLKIIDKDGSFTYSPVIAVKASESKEFSFKIYPIPGRLLVADITSTKQQRVSFLYYDASGKLLAKTIQTIQPGREVFNLYIPITGLSFIGITSGSYHKTVPLFLK